MNAANQSLDPDELNTLLDGEGVGKCKAIASVTIDGPSTGAEDDITFSIRIGQDGETLSVGQLLKKASVRPGHVADLIRRVGDGMVVSYVRHGAVASTSMGFAGDAAIRDIDGYTNTHGTAGDVALLLCGNILEGGLDEETPRSASRPCANVSRRSGTKTPSARTALPRRDS